MCVCNVMFIFLANNLRTLFRIAFFRSSYELSLAKFVEAFRSIDLLVLFQVSRFFFAGLLTEAHHCLFCIRQAIFVLASSICSHARPMFQLRLCSRKSQLQLIYICA